jgi:hypothetical protein
MNKFTSILLTNIHPNPTKRETLEQTSEKFNKLLEETNDWSFMRDVTLSKIEKLYTVLQN